MASALTGSTLLSISWNAPPPFFWKGFQLLPVIISLLSSVKINILYWLYLNKNPVPPTRMGIFLWNKYPPWLLPSAEALQYEILPRFQNIHQIMRNSLHFFRSGSLPRPIPPFFYNYLHGICRSDLSFLLPLQGKWKDLFSLCRRSGQYDQGLFPYGSSKQFV